MFYIPNTSMLEIQETTRRENLAKQPSSLMGNDIISAMTSCGLSEHPSRLFLDQSLCESSGATVLVGRALWCDMQKVYFCFSALFTRQRYRFHNSYSIYPILTFLNLPLVREPSLKKKKA